MGMRQIVAPIVLPVTLAQARSNLRVDGTDMDALIEVWIAGVTAKLEHETGQCLMEQTWEVALDRFPCAAAARVPIGTAEQILLPHPVISVESVTYRDAAGNTQTLAQAAYVLRRRRHSTVLAPAAGTSWPDSYAAGGEVVVTVVCGYGTAPVNTPPNVQLYILAKLVEQFDPMARPERGTVQSTFIDGLLDPSMVYG